MYQGFYKSEYEWRLLQRNTFMLSIGSVEWNTLICNFIVILRSVRLPGEYCVTSLWILYFLLQAIDSYYQYSNAANAYYPYQYVPTTLSGTTTAVPSNNTQTYVLDLPPANIATGEFDLICKTYNKCIGKWHIRFDKFWLVWIV